MNDVTEIQCLNLTGELETLASNAGVGSLAPNGNYIAYTTTNRNGTSAFEYEVSLYIYTINTDSLILLRDGDGHIAANWVATNALIISTWDDRITSPVVFEPSHRFLYNPESHEIVELEWPTGNGSTVVGYWLKEESFLFANNSEGLSQITLDGTLTPIPLPYEPYNTDYVMSLDNLFIAYQTKCEKEIFLANCIAVYELGTDNVEVITAFAENYEALTDFTFSPTGRFVVVSLHPNDVIGIYDLEQKAITVELPQMDANGFVWARNQDSLFIAVPDEDNEQDNLSYIYVVHPLSGTMELAMAESVQWLGFY